jgi:hypothetical protein
MQTRRAPALAVVGAVVGALGGGAFVVRHGVFDAAESVGAPLGWIVIGAWMAGVPGLTALILWMIYGPHALAGASASAVTLSVGVSSPLWANSGTDSDRTAAVLAALLVFGSSLVVSCIGALLPWLLLEIWGDRSKRREGTDIFIEHE